MIMNKFIKYLLYAGIAFFCYLLYVSRPSYKLRPLGDMWNKSEECPYCDQTDILHGICLD